MKKFNFEWMNIGNKEFLKKLCEELIENNIDEKLLYKHGEEIFNQGISFAKLSIFLDEYSYALSLEEKKILKKNENILAVGYLKKRLPTEIKALRVSFHSNTNVISKKKHSYY
jgi:hypothetical protein